MATGDEILAWKKAAEKEQPIERTDCPNCGWSLEEHPTKGLHCPYCGYTDKTGGK